MTQTDKRFHITVLNDNTVKFVDYMVGTELLTISFKEHSDAVDCQNALQWQCDLMNDLYEDKEYYQIKSGKCEEELLNLRRENKELEQINHSVFKSIGNRIKFWKELAETNRSNSTLQRIVEDLEDLYKLKKGDLND